MTGNHFDLGFNCQGSGEDAFYEEVKRLARRYRISWVSVPKSRSAAFRRCVDEDRLKIRVFLNTQAEGTSPDNPSILLLRSLKEKNCLVVEDADDVRFHADKALQLSYLKRAGLPVPRYFVLNGSGGAAERHLPQGSTWLARPALGLNHRPACITATDSAAAALRKAGRRMLLYRHYKPLTLEKRILSFRIWHFFGHVVPCWYKPGERIPEMMKAADLASPLLPRLVALVKKIAEITLLNWFVTDLVVTGRKKAERLMIQEPANALAGLGPGIKRLGSVPPEVIRIAAHRIVEVSWRKARNLPLADEITIRLLP